MGGSRTMQEQLSSDSVAGILAGLVVVNACYTAPCVRIVVASKLLVRGTENESKIYSIV
jgi:hypothetical protein